MFNLKLEINHPAGHRFIEVSWPIFRSWSGERRVNGKPFHGPNFYFLSNERAPGSAIHAPPAPSLPPKP